MIKIFAAGIPAVAVVVALASTTAVSIGYLSLVLLVEVAKKFVAVVEIVVVEVVVVVRRAVVVTTFVVSSEVHLLGGGHKHPHTTPL